MNNNMDIIGLPKNILVTDDLLWKRGKGSKDNSMESAFLQNIPNLSNFSNIKIPPDWERIPSKGVKMSEEEFEKAIADIARRDAERGKEIKDAAKGMMEGEEIRIRMLTGYISVASPDRKAAYEKAGGIGDTIYGSYGLELMQRGSDGKWQASKLTSEESARASKFYDIYRAAYAEYEAENGPVPTSKTTDPQKLMAGYNAYNASTYGAYNAYNFWA